MMELILHVYHRTKALLAEHVDLDAIRSCGVMELVIKVKYDIPNRELQRFDTLTRQIDGMLDALWYALDLTIEDVHMSKSFFISTLRGELTDEAID